MSNDHRFLINIQAFSKDKLCKIKKLLIKGYFYVKGRFVLKYFCPATYSIYSIIPIFAPKLCLWVERKIYRSSRIL